MMRTRSARGQSLIEFALIFPLVLFLLMGFFDLGRAVFYFSSLSNAVREGTRSGIVNKTYLEDAESGDDLGRPVMVIQDEGDQMCLLKTGELDTLRCIIYRKSFGMKDSLDPRSDENILPEPIRDPDDPELFEKIKVTAKYCYTPVTPGIMLIVNTTCNGKKGIPLIAQSIMYVVPAAK